jgi:hypothetical protein
VNFAPYFLILEELSKMMIRAMAGAATTEVLTATGAIAAKVLVAERLRMVVTAKVRW